MSNYEDITESGVMYAHQTDSDWNVQNLGVIPTNSTFSFDTANIVDMTFNIDKKPVMLVDGQVGSIGGAGLWGGLTYATLQALPSAPENNNWQIIAAAIAITAITSTTIIVVFKRKRSLRMPNCLNGCCR